MDLSKGKTSCEDAMQVSLAHDLSKEVQSRFVIIWALIHFQTRIILNYIFYKFHTFLACIYVLQAYNEKKKTVSSRSTLALEPSQPSYSLGTAGSFIEDNAAGAWNI